MGHPVATCPYRTLASKIVFTAEGLLKQGAPHAEKEADEV